MWEKINEHVTAFVIGTVLLGGLLYAAITAYAMNMQVTQLKEEFAEYRKTTNASLEVIKEQLATALLKNGRLSPEQLKDLITKIPEGTGEIMALVEIGDLSDEELEKWRKAMEIKGWLIRRNPDESQTGGKR